MKEYEWTLKYSPDQPRIPAGSSTGGQWTSQGWSPETQEALEHYERRYGKDQDIARVARDKEGGEVFLTADSYPTGDFRVDAYRKNGERIGSIAFGLRDHKLWIWRQAVVENEQGKGIGTLMMKRARERWPDWEITVDESLSPLTNAGRGFWESLTDGN